VYLPADDLDRFGVELAFDDRGALVDSDGRLSALITFSARRAEQWYDDGLRLVPLLDRRSAACCRAMAGIYRQLLARIGAQPSAVLDRRLSLSGWQKAGVAARALTGLGA
jgi:phytoene synthase